MNLFAVFTVLIGRGLAISAVMEPDPKVRAVHMTLLVFGLVSVIVGVALLQPTSKAIWEAACGLDLRLGRTLSKQRR